MNRDAMATAATAPTAGPTAVLTTGGEFRAGWRVLLGSVLGVSTGVSGLLLYTNGLFVADLERTLGLTRTQFGLGILIVTLALAVANPVVGWAIDRFGVRRPAAAGLLFLAGGFALLGTLTSNVAEYMALQALAALFGAASGPIAYIKTVSAWFHRSRGLALGITLMGIGLAAAIMPPLVAMMIAAEGWRSGYLLLAGIALIGLIPLLLLIRLPHGVADAGHPMHDGMSVGMAMRTRTFWVMLSAFATMALGFSGLLPHFVPMLSGMGVSPVKAAGMAGLIGIAVIGSRVVIGAVVDRVFAPWVAIGVCMLCAAGCLILVAAGRDGAPLGALALGVAMGGEVDLIGFLVGRYFGLASFGRIYGLFYAAFILASGISPLWMGIVYDHTGSYRLALFIVVGLLALASILFLMLPGYKAIPHQIIDDS